MVGDITEEPHCKKSSFFIEKVVRSLNDLKSPCLSEPAPFLINVNVH